MSTSESSIAALSEPFLQGCLDTKPDARVLFIHARPSPLLERWPKASVTCLQSFKPYAEALETYEFSLAAQLPEESQYDLALVLVPKNMKEAMHDLAVAFSHLTQGGVLVCAADNKAGGSRLAKMLGSLGLEQICSLSRHKARCAWGVKSGPSALAPLWLAEGDIQAVMDGAFVSRPGLFSWDRLDAGSAILQPFLPPDLMGSGADFGCGYGALSRSVLDAPAVSKLYCIDADSRALSCCQKNLGDDPRAEFIWADLTAPAPLPLKLDFIVMNPPFHEGKHESTEIGRLFIKSAAQSLKPGGRLLMVANTHLPYEHELETLFSRVQKLHQESGFKIISAVL